ncbi:PREDICTED: PCNA-interacting partner isoform X4 [Corvus brachyrhynchos]|uniref:PCNA-interacting partner isoform X4 n=1 Tax=Corvus brachyrhynchos TaxID=85066 RepID=UPI0008167BC8|nr:PREDICTED: PCNA-interacting partner isoform X4 [Corvus brachyrhynchos]
MATSQQKILHLVKCFRRQWPLFSNSERTTVCGADCMLMALQLSMAEVNKQHHGDFTVSLSDVLETWKYLLHDKLGLSYENMKEPENYADVKKAYHAFLARSNMFDLIDICQKCYSLGLLPEDESISPVQLLEFISGVLNAQENNGSVLSTPTQINSQGQEHMKVTILAKKSVCSYLSLLVNSKDDLALAHILNVPDRGLGREAFTNLKHASQERKMSIFLMATSFIRTMELGGRDSASSLYDPLRAHVKGLSSFVNFIDKLQEIVGEILNTRIAGGRILSTVKMHLIKGRSNGDPFCQAVEEVVQDLDLKIKNIIDSQQETLTASTTGVSPARMKQSSIKSQFACTYKNDLSEMSGQHSHAIPTCKHPVPKQRSKDGKCTEGTNSCLDVPVLGTISESVHQTRSYTEMGKLSCQPRNKNSENEQMDLNNDKIICDKESEPSLQKNTKRLKTSNSSQKDLDSKIGKKRKQTKTASKNKLIAGQAKLTRFFQL